MITAAITAIITAVLGFFGHPPSAKTIGITVVVVKVCVVLLALVVGPKFFKKKKEAEAQAPE